MKKIIQPKVRKLFDAEYFGAFEKLDLKPKCINIVGFDSEDDTKGKPLAFSFYDGGAVLKKKSFFTTSAEEAVKFIYDYPIESYFVAHNLEYDLPNLMGYNDFIFVDEIIKAPLMLRVSLLGTKHVLLNSLSYFKGSVEQMGKLIGRPKLGGKEKSQLNPAYAIRDAEIPWAYMDMFQKRLVNDFGVPLSLSIGSIAMQIYRNRFMDRNEQATYNNPLLKEAYYGGRVEVFHRGISDEINVCDINSSYPNVMKNFEYPDTQFLEKSKLKTHRFGVGRFKVTVPKTVFTPVLPLKSASGRLFFPVGTFEGYWTYAEIRKAIEQGAKVEKEYDGIGTNAAVSPFRDFVEYFYGMRLVCKDRIKKDPDDLDAKFESNLLKDIQNNLYGKFFQWKAKTKLSRRPIPEGMLEDALGEYDEKRTGSFWEYIQKEGKAPKTANFMWGLHVTAYARLELLKHLETVVNNGGTLLYCDTDSIMFTGKKALAKMPVSTALGDLSHETYAKGMFRQAKGYLLFNRQGKKLVIEKVACKGVATTHAYEFIVEGVATSVKPMRFKEALIRVNVPSNKQKVLDKLVGFNIWRDVKKTMNAIDIKRTPGIGKTYPVNAKDIETLEENATQTAEDWSPKLSKNPVLREKKEEYFRGVVPPEGWFKETGLPEEIAEPKTKAFYIRRLDLKAVKPGQVWFSGDVIKSRDIKGRACVEIILGAYFGEFFTHRAITALLPLRTLKILEANEKKILGKRIVVSKDEDDE
ncbi:MAG TPA: DNA polymerase, partial [Pyrinomonadaceae bacterium]|nr:DNA polymerase [Pyrinomonadaceae bacterium]